MSEKKIELPYPIRVRSQGRITIPYEVRKALGLEDGDRVYLTIRKADEGEEEEAPQATG